MRQPRRLGIVEWVTIGYNKVGPQEEKPRQRTAETRERTQRRRVDERGHTMSEHTHNEHEKAREGRKHHKTFAERDPLAAEEPDVLESSASDPEFPAMQEFEVDRGGPKANTRKHPGLIWIIVAIVAVIGLCVAFAAAGDWMNPTQAEKVQQTELEEQTVPEDLGANENPEAA